MSDIVFVQGFESNSASPTDIWEVRYKDIPAIMKIFIYSDEGKESTSAKFFLNEAAILKKIQGSVQPGNARFYMPFLTAEVNVEIDPLYTFVKNQGVSLFSFWRNILYMYSPAEYERIFNSPRKSVTNASGRPSKLSDEYVSSELKQMNRALRLGYIIMPKINGSKLFDVINGDFSMILAYKCGLLAQAFFAMYCLAEAGINQNDLHWDNIFVAETTPRYSENFIIVFNQHVYYLTDQRHRPLIYDFDRGVVQGQSSDFLAPYTSAGNCPSFNFKRDLIKGMFEWFGYLPLDLETEEERTTAELLKTFIFSSELMEAVRGEEPEIMCSDDALKYFKAKELVDWLLYSNYNSLSETCDVFFDISKPHPFRDEFEEMIERAYPSASADIRRKAARENICADAANRANVDRFINSLF